MSITDTISVLKWFIALLVIGSAFLPATFSLFSNFKDKGYIFSKIAGMILVSYLTFLLGTIRLIPFSAFSVYFSLIIFIAVNYYMFSYRKKLNIIKEIKSHAKIFALEELIFLIMLFYWAYVRAHFPDIHGLEKFMDFGFLNTILRSTYFPPRDMWYTPYSINYYYFGHLVTAVLTKFTFIPSFISFNLMLATLFALTFSAAFSIITNVFDNVKFSFKSLFSGLAGAVLLVFGGNLTTIYAFFQAYEPQTNPVPFWQLPFLPFSFPNGYWYPNATRFIPFTIHEFPIYSFVVSDLHGHVLDIPFVLLTIAVFFSLIITKKVKLVHLLFVSFLLAVMYMTNAWDGLIYMLLGFAVWTFINVYKENEGIELSGIDYSRLFKGFLILIAGFFVFSLPFNLDFKPFVSGIGVICAPGFLTQIGHIGPFLFEPNHCQRSPLWQLALLYGFFYFFVVSFLLFLKFKRSYKFTKSDYFILIIITLSTILIIVPEFIYVKDIYPTYYRANTMFKLVYEAFIMLSISCGYILIKLLTQIKNRKSFAVFFIFSLFLLTFVLMYPFFAINSYYRNLTTYEGLDGLKYMDQTYPEDYQLINWINKNIKGQPVILEANGDSYTDYARISANTGLPTVLGWTVHEWLWRGTYAIVAPRIDEVNTLYTTTNLSVAKQLIKKYNIQYVVVSNLERQKYPNLNENTFRTLGKVVYSNPQGATLYKINN